MPSKSAAAKRGFPKRWSSRKYRWRPGSRLLRQRGHVQTAERNVGAPRAVMVGERVGAIGRRYVDLNHDKVRRVLQVEPLDVLILEGHLVARIEVAGQRGQSERREQRVFDRSEIGADRLG
jgi:hypothetical protein